MPDATNPFSFANNYRKDGWQGTLWLPYRQKSAPPSGYHGWGAPYPSELDLAKWRKRGDGNIALRLGKLDPGYVPEGGKPCGYELVGIDIDDYRDKHGWNELLELEGKLGKLPPTVCSTSRWEQSEHTYTAVFMIPTGYILKGKAADCIDILYAGNRYLVVHPSIHPEGMTYEWRYGSGSTEWQTWDDGIPSAYECALLPEPWFEYLKRDNQSAYEKSDLGSSDLRDWATSTFRDGEPCNFMRKQTDKKIADLQNTPTSHDHLNNDTWYLTKLACEGHIGWRTCIVDYSNAWAEHAAEMRDADVDFGEINRCIDGAIAKNKVLFDKGEIENQIEPGVLPEDHPKCQTYESIAVGGWIDGEDVIAEGDYGGMGPIVGPMEINKPKPAEEYGYHDEGNAQHFLDIYGSNFKYVVERKSWVIWSNGRWYQDIDYANVRKAFRRVRLSQEQRSKFLWTLVPPGAKSSDPARRQAVACGDWARKSGELSRIRSSLDTTHHFEADGEPVSMRHHDFDSKPNLLGCINGVIELDADPRLREHRRDDYVTYNTNVEYVPWNSQEMHDGGLYEQFRLWDEYLELFLPDPKLRRFVQKVMGHCLIGGNPEKLLIFIYGKRNTGKTTLLGGLKGALGDYYEDVNRQIFTYKTFNPSLVGAVPRRIVGMNEIEGGALEAETIKMITGNSDVNIEIKNSNENFIGRPMFTPIVTCNNEPQIRNPDEALAKRVMVLPFDTQVADGQVKYDRQIEIEKYSGVAVLSWLVEGWRMYKQEGLSRKSWPAEVRRVSGEVIGSFSPTQQFIAECLEFALTTPDGKEAFRRATKKANSRGKHVLTVSDWDVAWTPVAANVYQLYLNWCQTNGITRPESFPELTRSIGLGKPQNRSIDGAKPRCYMGVRVKSDGLDD